MPTLRALAVLVIFVFSTLLLVPLQYVSLRLKLKMRRAIPNKFNRYLCWLFGIRISVIGTPIQDRGVLMIANHTSYFDILILGATARVSFVAKSEVASWPFFGMMSRLQESIFVERARRSRAGVARDELRERLRDGDALALFPEGTSTDGNRVIAFKSALFGSVEAPLGTDACGHPLYVPVQPISISYVGIHGMPMGRENRPLYAWYGDMELLPHLWEALKAGPLDVVVEFHPPLSVDKTGGRKKIAALAECIVRRGQRLALAGMRSAPAPAQHSETTAEAAL